MVTLPTGTFTFLFTDIQGSTRLWEEVPDAMQAALRDHDRLIQHVIETNNGHVFKTVGDAFCAAFTPPLDALQAALCIQHAILSHQWKIPGGMHVRVGLHTGEAECRDNDYFGQTLNRIARLLGTAHGDQVVVSSTTAALIRESLPDGVQLRDLGEHRLKDISRPERIFQVVAADLPCDFPPLNASKANAVYLPAQHTSFVGRRHDITALRGLIAGARTRLVTVTGPGGVGKTRLAIQLAAELADVFADGVYFVPLSSVSDPGLLTTALAHAAQLRMTAERDVRDELYTHFAKRHALLVLDNFEQLVAAGPELAALLSACPEVVLLVTSREPLHVAGEQQYPLEPLALPSGDGALSAGDVEQYDGLQLFVERARAVQPSFQLTDEGAAAVAEICRRLDGLPLAIELAASRVRLLPPRALLSRLAVGARHASPLHLLTGGPRDLPARQQTLRNAIAWSYDLLQPDEQRVFRSLAVFAGSFSLTAADELFGVEGAADQSLETIGSLVDKSLLREESGHDDEPRFRLLGTIREFAQEQLGDEAGPLKHRHAAIFLRLAEALDQKLTGPQQEEALWRLDDEHDNLRAALDYLISAGEKGTACRLVTALGRFWRIRGHSAEAGRWIDRALALDGEIDPALSASVLNIRGALAYLQHELADARVATEQSLGIYEQIGDTIGIGQAMVRLSMIKADEGDYAGSMELMESGLRLFREIGYERGVGVTLLNLGELARLTGQWQCAEERSIEALDVLRTIGDSHSVATALVNRGLVALARGEWQPAAVRLHEALVIARKLGGLPRVFWGLIATGRLAAETGQGERAAQLFGAAEAVRETVGGSLPASDAAAYERSLTAVRGAIGQPAFEREWQYGRSMGVEDAIELAMKVTGTT